ncbi:UNVERIFIED_CONTAM: hypothetical protein Sangu_0183200 [Sesamum angustifolium]|uniref:Uncharacterized protein n=1 Tax=Sesamum angustifolium TaxID=2727405 RepID=A0AAW2RM94_9LAMI
MCLPHPETAPATFQAALLLPEPDPSPVRCLCVQPHSIQPATFWTIPRPVFKISTDEQPPRSLYRTRLGSLRHHFLNFILLLELLTELCLTVSESSLRCSGSFGTL